MDLKLGNKGIAAVWFTALVSLLIVTLFYVAFHQIVDENLYDMAVANRANNSTLSFIISVWNAWPIIMLMGVIMWAILMSQKREPDTGYL